MAVEGVIADAARGSLPLTWDALSRDATFGDDLLQQAIDFVKDDVFGEVVPVDEEDTYPLKVIRYLGNLVALELIDPGIDLWMNQPTSESATGVNEVHTFVDRAEMLRRLGERLGMQVRAEEAEIDAILGRPTLKIFPRGDVNVAADEPLLTPAVADWPRPFVDTGR